MARIVEKLTPADVASRIFDGATIALTGSGIFLEADEVFRAIEKSFLATGRPRDLTLVHALGIGDGRGSGLGRFAHEGMVRRVIGGHWSWSPSMQMLAADNLIEAYSFPAGAISNLMREIGAGRPGLVTKIGLGTFADPRRDGGRCNPSARDTLVELVAMDGREYLRYKPLQIDFALIRATEVGRAWKSHPSPRTGGSGLSCGRPCCTQLRRQSICPGRIDSGEAQTACAPCTCAGRARRWRRSRAGFAQDLSSQLRAQHLRRGAAPRQSAFGPA